MEFYTAVERPADCRLIAGDRLQFPGPLGIQTGRSNALFCQPADNRIGSLLAQTLVIGISPPVIGMTNNDQSAFFCLLKTLE